MSRTSQTSEEYEGQFDGCCDCYGDRIQALEGERDRLWRLLTKWRAQTLDMPEDGAVLYPAVLLACAQELEDELAVLGEARKETRRGDDVLNALTEYWCLVDHDRDACGTGNADLCERIRSFAGSPVENMERPCEMCGGMKVVSVVMEHGAGSTPCPACAPTEEK